MGANMKHQFTGLNFLDPMHGVVFDPVTLAAMGSMASTVGTIATIASPVMGMAAAAEQNKADRRQAAELERQGIESEVAANVEAAMYRKSSRHRQARDKASQIEAGVYSGTAYGVEEQNMLVDEREALMIEYQGEQQRKGAQFNAAEYRASASPLRVLSAAVSGFSSMDPLNLAYGGGATRRGGGVWTKSE